MEQMLKKNNIKMPSSTSVNNRLQSSKSVRNANNLHKFESASNFSAYKKPGVPREVFLKSQYDPSDQSMEFYGTSSDVEMPGTRSPSRTQKSESPEERKSRRQTTSAEPKRDQNPQTQIKMQAMETKIKQLQEDLAKKNTELGELKKQDHPQLQKQSIKDAMQQIITAEVEQRMKVWVAS